MLIMATCNFLDCVGRIRRKNRRSKISIDILVGFISTKDIVCMNVLGRGKGQPFYYRVGVYAY